MALRDDTLESVRRLSPKKRPVVRFVVVATTISCLLLIATAGWFMYALHEERVRDAEVSSSNVARMVGAQIDAAMKAATVILVDVRERVESGAQGEGSAASLHAHLLALAASMPELHGIFVYDADGIWQATSSSSTMTGNNADRDYFQRHRTHTGRNIDVGPPIQSRSTGDWIIPVSIRLEAPGGGFAGVALVTFKVDFFERIYDDLDIGKDGTVVLALTDGTIVYRKPFHEGIIGTNLSNGAIWGQLKNKPVGSAMLVAKIDGIERLMHIVHYVLSPLSLR